jgi:hypothetical protein
MARLSQAGYGSYDMTPVVKASEMEGKVLAITAIETASTRFGDALCYHVTDLKTNAPYKVFMGITEKRLAMAAWLKEHPQETIYPVGVKKVGQWYVFFDIDESQLPLPFPNPDQEKEGSPDQP